MSFGKQLAHTGKLNFICRKESKRWCSERFIRIFKGDRGYVRIGVLEIMERTFLLFLDVRQAVNPARAGRKVVKVDLGFEN